MRSQETEIVWGEYEILEFRSWCYDTRSAERWIVGG